MENQKQIEKTLKERAIKFFTVGATAGFVGLLATSEQLATNSIAQQVGAASAIVAALGVIGGAWAWATISDLRNKSSIKNEISNTAKSITDIFMNLRKKMNTEETSSSINKLNLK